MLREILLRIYQTKKFSIAEYQVEFQVTAQMIEFYYRELIDRGLLVENEMGGCNACGPNLKCGGCAQQKGAALTSIRITDKGYRFIGVDFPES